jgi:hypothetical protein
MYVLRFPNHEWHWGGYYRLPTWRIPLFGKKRRIIPPRFSKRFHKRMPLDYHPYGGSTWWALPTPAVEHIRNFAKNHPEFIRYFQELIYPDEMMFHTILSNSPFKPEIGDHYLHVMKWTMGPHPAVLTEQDLPLLRESDRCFARKFEEAEDGGILDLIDRELLS